MFSELHVCGRSQATPCVSPLQQPLSRQKPCSLSLTQPPRHHTILEKACDTYLELLLVLLLQLGVIMCTKQRLTCKLTGVGRCIQQRILAASF